MRLIFYGKLAIDQRAGEEAVVIALDPDEARALLGSDQWELDPLGAAYDHHPSGIVSRVRVVLALP